MDSPRIACWLENFLFFCFHNLLCFLVCCCLFMFAFIIVFIKNHKICIVVDAADLLISTCSDLFMPSLF